MPAKEADMPHRAPRQRVWPDPFDDDETADRRTASLAGVAVALLLIVVGLFIVQQLYTKMQIEDCLLAGRTNCSALVPAGPAGAPPRR